MYDSLILLARELIRVIMKQSTGMKDRIKSLFASFRDNSVSKRSSDFSDFFSKSSGDKAKVVRQVLREANEEQRRVMQGR